jgi:hypothetical protein
MERPEAAGNRAKSPASEEAGYSRKNLRSPDIVVAARAAPTGTT